MAVALSAGAAAAYTGNLPDPVQQLAHTVIGAPAPETPAPRAEATPGHGRHASSAPSGLFTSASVGAQHGTTNWHLVK